MTYLQPRQLYPKPHEIFGKEVRIVCLYYELDINLKCEDSQEISLFPMPWLGNFDLQTYLRLIYSYIKVKGCLCD